LYASLFSDLPAGSFSTLNESFRSPCGSTSTVLSGEEERNAAQRALMVPHSRWACPSCRVGVVALGPGMGRYDDAHGGFDPRRRP